VGRLTETDIAIEMFKKQKPTPIRYLEKPKTTDYREIKSAIFFGFSPCIQPVLFAIYLINLLECLHESCTQ